MGATLTESGGKLRGQSARELEELDVFWLCFLLLPIYYLMYFFLRWRGQVDYDVGGQFNSPAKVRMYLR